MIQSLFILSPVGEVLIERHFRGVVTSRAVCDAFWDVASRDVNHHGGISATTSLLVNEQLYDNVPPVMEVPESDHGTLYLISVLRDGLSYLAVCPAEVSPLLILEFLHRVADVFVEYFGPPADEAAVKDNFSTVYQLLEDMVDYGWPLTTEPNALKAMIRPPTVMSRLLQTANAISDELPSGTISNMPWRAAGVYYSQNEIYVDIAEEVDAIVSPSGALISVDVSGNVTCQSHLSGVPDLLLTFKDPQLIDDCSFHPCVRYARYERDQVVSFVPPDGNFELMRYRIKPEQIRGFTPPVYCHAQWSFRGMGNDSTALQGSGATTTTTTTTTAMQTGRVVLQAGLATFSSLVFSASRTTGPNQVEEFAVNIPFPKQTRTTRDFQVNMGTVLYDEAGKVARWNLGTLDQSKRASLTCTFTLDTSSASSQRDNNDENDDHNGMAATSTNAATATTGTASTASGRSSSSKRSNAGGVLEPPNIYLNWKVPLASVSGLTVSGLSVMGENYRPYKGVRNITKSGLFQVRGS